MKHLSLGDLSTTPLVMRGLWCVARWSSATQQYTQIGQAFFYNNDTFTFNFLDNPTLTWVEICHEIIDL